MTIVSDRPLILAERVCMLAERVCMRAPRAAGVLSMALVPVFLLANCGSAALASSLGPSGDVRTFGGYACAADCFGQAEGYEWAERNRVDTPEMCEMGRSRFFIEGCYVYLDDPHRGARRDDSGRPL